MAFETLTGKLNNVFKKLRSRGRLTEADVREAMREIRMALLEADVGFKVVKSFIASVTEKAIGENILESLSPAQQVVKIVNDELCALMGGTQSRLNMASSPPTVIMFAGLQGAGKTTNIAKLASYYKTRENRRPLLVACDVYRPAAIQQLKIVAEKLSLPVFEKGQGDPVAIAREAVEHARRHGNDMVFIDTAGRLHVDEQLMDELRRIKSAVSPNEIMLVVDGMTGQDAVNAAETFDAKLGITSVFITKLDGDTRGGAALSVRAMTGKPIKFCGMGEKLDAIEPFYPDRMASRILGMGDVMTLIEKAQQSFDEKKAAELEKKMRRGKLTLTDFYDQLNQLKEMGGVGALASMLPGAGGKALAGAQIDDKQMARMEALILSMTPKERDNPEILNFSRKKRITAGCGLRIEDLNRLLKQFDAAQKMARQMSGMSPGKMRKGMKGFPF